MSDAPNVPERSVLTPVSYVIFRRGNSVLLQLRQGTGFMDGYWATAAAGHVEAGESASGAAVREAHEELGIVISADQLVPLATMHRTQPGSLASGGRVDFFFTCAAWSGDPVIMERDKSAGLEWFDLDDLPRALVPHERYVFERLKTGLPVIIDLGP